MLRPAASFGTLHELTTGRSWPDFWLKQHLVVAVGNLFPAFASKFILHFFFAA